MTKIITFERSPIGQFRSLTVTVHCDQDHIICCDQRPQHLRIHRNAIRGRSHLQLINFDPWPQYLRGYKEAICGLRLSQFIVTKNHNI